jgi:hypothetical protein
MKITNQTTDEMSLKSGNTTQRIIGFFVALFGLSLAYLPFGHIGVWSSPLAPAIVFLAGVLLFIAGLLTVLFSASILVTIIKSNNQIIYQKKEVVGTKQTTYTISNVLRIEIRKRWDRSTQRGIKYRLAFQSVIVFKDGSELLIDNVNNGSGVPLGVPGIFASGQADEENIANQIATFIRVPFQEIDPPSKDESPGGNFGGVQL